MTTQATIPYTRSSTTECLPKPNIWSYLEELLGHFIARSFGTSKDMKYESFGQAICYDDSRQEPFVQMEDIHPVQEALTSAWTSQKNLRAIKLLEEWFAQPDDLGDETWEMFEKELKANKFTI